MTLRGPWHILTIGPSLACALTVQEDLPGTRTGAEPTHHATSRPSSPESPWVCVWHLLPPAHPSILQTPGLVQALGSLRGEAAEDSGRPLFTL